MGEESVAVWNLVQYLIVRYQIAETSAARAALMLGGALLCIFVPYLLGSVNPAVLISRHRPGGDVRDYGDGSAGTGNMLRVYGKKYAAITLVCEALLTAAAYWFGFFLFFGYTGGGIAGFFAVFGHIFPVFAKFRGGKGVVCLAVVALCISPLTFAILLAIWLVVAFGTRFVSLASVMSALLFPLILRAFTGESAGLAVAMAVAASVTVVIRHKENLSRLYHGKEPKLTFPKRKPKKNNAEDSD